MLGLDPDAHLGLDLRRRRRGRGDLGARRSACPPSASCGWAPRTTSGAPGPPVRAAVLRALLRSGPRARLRFGRVRPGLRLRPLPRVLEPRVHAVRPAGGRHAAPAAQAEHRHRHGARADRRDPAGRRTRTSRPTSCAASWRIAEEITGVKYGIGGRNDTSLRILADHARAVTFMIADGILPAQRGPRLRASPPAAPRGAARAAARRRGPVPASGSSTDVIELHGRRLPRDRRAPRAHRPHRGRARRSASARRCRQGVSFLDDGARRSGRIGRRHARRREWPSRCTTRTASRSS